jgi:hypothetical protein
MRVSILTFGAVPALAAATQSALLAPQPAGIDVNAALPIKLVNHVRGWRRVHWQDHWGRWHWRCVPYGHAHHGRTNLEHFCADWRGPTSYGNS